MKMMVADQTKVIEKFGKEAQFGIHMEECAELIQAISKYMRYGGRDERSDIVEEIADVMICIKQLKQILNISNAEIQARIDLKQERMDEILRECK